MCVYQIDYYYIGVFFFSSRRRHTRCGRDWRSDVCSSDLQAGYEAGAKAVNPDINILVEYIGDSVQAFVDQTKGEALSSKMYDQGADVIFHGAGEPGLGLFKAAVEAGDPDKLAIGVDSDQYRPVSEAEQSHILTS